MTDPAPYVLFPGTAREALTFYGGFFGCSVELHTFAEFGRDDGTEVLSWLLQFGGIGGQRPGPGQVPVNVGSVAGVNAQREDERVEAC